MDELRQLKEMQQLVEAWLEELAPAGEGLHKEIFRAANYSLKAWGKRLRPVLALAVCEMLGGQPEQVKHLACAVEFIHTYSLIHDDLPCMDDDDLRRGLPTNHVKFGECMALLAGDTLLNYAFETIAKAKLPAERVVAALAAISNASGANGMIGGQVIDIEGAKDEAQLLTVHRMKTGALIGAAVQAGAIAAGADVAQQETLSDYAVNLGLAFQIRDDILDVTGDQAVLGKPIGSDADSEKCTFVTLFGVEGAGERLKEYTCRAKKTLAPFGADARFLLWLADYLVEREQ